MGCCCSEPEDPLMEQYRRARSFDAKARIILQLAGKEEKRGRIVTAFLHYGTHLRCMAVHLFKEFDRRKVDEMINVAQSCRRIYGHRASLRTRAVHQSQQNAGCCSDPPISGGDPPAPAALMPFEWTEFLNMCKGSGSIEAALEKMGLLKMESRKTEQLRLAEAAANKTNVSVALTNQVSNNNSNQVNPNINVSGPSTNISGPTTSTSTTVSPNMSNAQTGEGNVAPSTGTGAAGSATGGQSSAAAAPAAVPAPVTPMAMPAGTMAPGGFVMVPMAGGGYAMMPAGSGGGSGDYAAAMAAMAAQQQQQQQIIQQQQMMQAAGAPAQQPMYFMPPGQVAPQMVPAGGQAMPQYVRMDSGVMPYMMPPAGSGVMMAPAGSGQLVMPPGTMPMPAGYPAAVPAAPATPAVPSAPAPPPGYPPPEAPVQGVPVGKTA